MRGSHGGALLAAAAAAAAACPQPCSLLRCALPALTLCPRSPLQGKKFVPLRTVEAAAGDLAWRQAFSAKLGRHVVAGKDLPAGTLVLMDRPVVAVPRSK